LKIHGLPWVVKEMEIRDSPHISKKESSHGN